jgi:hypothetical protein
VRLRSIRGLQEVAMASGMLEPLLNGEANLSMSERATYGRRLRPRCRGRAT